jgi:hypothetical protein
VKLLTGENYAWEGTLSIKPIHGLKTYIDPITAIANKKLTDARQLFTEHHIEYAGPTDLRLHQHHPWVTGNDFSDDDGIASMFVLPHLMQHRLRHLRCNHGQQFSLVGHVERIQPEHLASAFDRVANRN